MVANAILGEWPEIKGLYLANGFSDHGLQQGAVVGRYMAELVTRQAVTLDLSIFNPKRVFESLSIQENGIV
jgi:FAD-dependent oxidoreductase domain-containing protein 1